MLNDIPEGAGVGLAEFFQRVHFQGVDYSLHYLQEVVLDQFDLDPDYQRAHVWTSLQQKNFLGHVMCGGRVPLIFIRDYMDVVREKYEVVDGKQRLTAFLAFVRGEQCARILDGREIWYRDFTKIERRRIPTIKCGIVKLENRADVLRFYLRINSGGTDHTEEELERVRALLREEEA
jgi:hypothetical protein